LAHEVNAADIERNKENLKKLEQLEKLYKEMIESGDFESEEEDEGAEETAKDITEQQAAIKTAEVVQEVYEDLESEELNAGSKMITTTAEVHCYQSNDQAASQQHALFGKPQRNEYRESLADIRQMTDEEIIAKRQSSDPNCNDAAFDKKAKQKTRIAMKKRVSVDSLEDFTFIE